MRAWIAKKVFGLAIGAAGGPWLWVGAGVLVAAALGYVGWLHWSIASAEAGRLKAELEVTRLEGAVQRAGAANATLMLNNQLLQQEMVERPAAIVDVVTRVGAFREALADNLTKVLDVDVSRASPACELVPLWIDAWLDGHERLRFEAGADPGALRAGAGRGDRAGP